jgi:hypothetical protein
MDLSASLSPGSGCWNRGYYSNEEKGKDMLSRNSLLRLLAVETERRWPWQPQRKGE